MKTNFKRLLAVALSALLLVGSFSIVAFADEEPVATPENLAASATVIADGKEIDVVNDGDITTAYETDPQAVALHQYGNEIVLNLAKRSFVASVNVAAYNWASKNANSTFKVYVDVDGEWVYAATVAMPENSADETITGTATFAAVMTDKVKVVAEAVGKLWMPKVNEIEIYSKDLGDDGFDDVQAEDWYAAAVAYVNVNGLMNGVSEVIFNPAGVLTYAEMAQILYNLAGKPAVKTEATFSDVDAEAWYADAVAWAEANKIAAGNEDGTFTPTAVISREEIAAYIYNYAVALNVYTADRGDVSVYEDAADLGNAIAMKWAVSIGLLSGRTATELAPAATATRAEVATILMRFNEWLKTADENYERNVALHGTAYASSQRGSSSADKAIDGDAGTYWQAYSEKNADGEYTGTANWGVKFEEAYDINAVTLTVANFRSWGGDVTGVTYKVEALVNGAWTTVATANDSDAYSATNKATLTFRFEAPVTATEIKITGTVDVATASYVKPAIYEVELTGIEAGRGDEFVVITANNASASTIVASSSTNVSTTGAASVDADATYKTVWMPLAEKDADGNYAGANIVYTFDKAVALDSLAFAVTNYVTWGFETGVDYVVEALIGDKWVEVMSFNDADAGDATSPVVVISKDFTALISVKAIKVTASNYAATMKPRLHDTAINVVDKAYPQDVDITAYLAEKSFANGMNAWSGGANEIFDSNPDNSAAIKASSEVIATFVEERDITYIVVTANNHNVGAPGNWGNNDLVYVVDALDANGEWVNVTTYSQRENDPDLVNSKIASKIDLNVTTTSIRITVSSAHNWYSYMYGVEIHENQLVFVD